MASFTPHEAALRELLTNPTGAVGRDLTRRVVIGSSVAKQRVRVDTGRLKGSVTWHVAADGQGLFGVIGTNVPYGFWQEVLPEPRGRSYLRPGLAAAVNA